MGANVLEQWSKIRHFDDGVFLIENDGILVLRMLVELFIWWQCTHQTAIFRLQCQVLQRQSETIVQVLQVCETSVRLIWFNYS